jgi:hypothetical protein
LPPQNRLLGVTLRLLFGLPLQNRLQAPRFLLLQAPPFRLLQGKLLRGGARQHALLRFLLPPLALELQGHLPLALLLLL